MTTRHVITTTAEIAAGQRTNSDFELTVEVRATALTGKSAGAAEDSLTRAAAADMNEIDAVPAVAALAESSLPAGATTPPQIGLSGLSPWGWLRWGWRQLTSMRTALLLLLLLALAAVPGSLLPQRNNNPAAVTAWIRSNPFWGQTLDRLSGFNVFSSPWFSAIYLLLCVSLTGCLVPRLIRQWRAMRADPTPAPRRSPQSAISRSWETEVQVVPRPPESVRARLRGSAGPEAALGAEEPELAAAELKAAFTDQLESVAARWRSRRWRVRVESFDGKTGSVVAEKGYLRETGNLLFHLSLLALLFAVAAGLLFGWRGQALIVEGQGWSDTLTQYDSFQSGRLVDPARLPPFSLRLRDFSATYQDSGKQRGAPRAFQAAVDFRPEPAAAEESRTIAVNSPLSIDGARVYLIAHGYAPVLRIQDASGQVVYDGPTVFLPGDSNFTSNGVIKMPDTDPQLALQGIFLPTTSVDSVKGPVSTFPAPDDPSVFLAAWKGKLGLDNGVPQNVYTLDTADLERIGIKALRPGESWELPGRLGKVTFTGVKEYATFDVAFDPGKVPALIAGMLVIIGLMLSLFVSRRRIWLRISAMPAADYESSAVEIAGTARRDQEGLTKAVDELAGSARTCFPPI